ASEAMRAVGAKPVWFGSADPVARFGGVEDGVQSVFWDRYGKVDRYLTANVNLWPRPLVLFANRKVYDALSPTQQSVLRRAAAAAIPDEAETVRAAELAAAVDLCGGGLHFATATGAELVALRRAVQPVYDTLERDPKTAAAIPGIGSSRPSGAAAASPQPAHSTTRMSS